MKLKPKHFEVAKTMAYFVDSNYYPEFVEPTREQIDIFTQIETRGRSKFTPEQLQLVAPLLHAKQMYDLQVKMIHEELADWIINGWGWQYPITSIIQKVWPDRKKCKVYIQFLLALYRKMKNNTGLSVMLNYSGFTDEFKNKLSSDYFAKL